jgi:glycosyltransferase domain-containing protein
MLITVGIPTYKRVEGLKRALDSILSQTYKNLEVIISNDNSPVPEMFKVIEEYARKDARIRFIHHSKALRTVANFSYVKDNARGKYFLWVADDDWLDPNYIATCVDFLENNPDFSIAAGKCYYHKDFNTVLHSSSNFSIENDSPSLRIYKYFRTVTLNGYYYGVMRTDLAKEFIMPNQLGFDWNIVAYMCFKGKLKTLENTGNHISKGGMSNEGTALSAYFDQKGIIAENLIGLRTALNCSANIFKSSCYQINLFSKIWFSSLIFMASYSHIISWDLILLKRRFLKSLKLNKNGVLFGKD